MCLVSETDIPSIAKEDITVYKVFTSDNRGVFTNFDYSSNIDKRFDDTSEERIQDTSEGKYLIDKGFIHSCGNINAAIILAYTAKDYFEVNFVIRKCIIPKGTKYYSDGYEYASKSIVIGNAICV